MNHLYLRKIIHAIFIICLSAACCAATELHFRNFAAKYLFVDSVANQFNEDDYYRNFERVRATVDELEKDADKSSDEELINLVARFRIGCYVWAHKMSVSEAESQLQAIIKRSHEANLRYVEADATQALAKLYMETEAYAKGFENYLAAYILYESFTATEFPAKEQFLYYLGSAYYRYGDNENALNYIMEASKQSTFKLRKKGYTEYNTIGLCYRNLGKYDSAEYYLKTVYDTATHYKDSVWAGIAYGNIAINYAYQHKYAEAIPMLEKDIQTCISHSIIKNAVSSMYTLAQVYFQQNDFSKAEQILNEALSLSRGKGYWHDFDLSEKLFTLMFRVYTAQNKMAEATVYADSAMRAKDSSITNKNMLAFAKLQGKIDLFRHHLDTEKLENARRIDGLVRNGLIAGIVLLTIIGLLFYNRQKLKHKELESQKRMAEAELQAASAKLDNFRLTVLEKNQAIAQYETEIGRMNKDTEEQTENEILAQLEQSTILTDAQWEDFRQLFEKVHPTFFISLKKKLPDLTQAEVRYLALTKLRLSSKEMAAMLGISPNAIRLYRHRLRKKLNMDKDDMIEELVSQL